jgi:hypothetical protein
MKLNRRGRFILRGLPVLLFLAWLIVASFHANYGGLQTAVIVGGQMATCFNS